MKPSLTKEYLPWENARNRRFHKLFSDILTEACGDDGVLIAHHLTCGSDDEPNEIPSADTLIFDHEIMGRIFGDDRDAIMVELALLPAEQRDARLAEFYYSRDNCPEFAAERCNVPAERRVG